MGLNVGGIYVKVVSGLTQDTVLATIRSYWLANGAKKSAADPLTFETLGLEKTGELGFAVLPAKRSASGEWIGVYDSERYRADPQLAAHLAKTLATEVWLYQMTETANTANARQYGGKAKALRGEAAVQRLVESLPFSFLYFDKIEQEIPAKERARFRCLGFEKILHRPRRTYSGPTAKQLRSNAKTNLARKLALKRDAAGLRKLATDLDVVYDVILSAVENADLANQAEARFVCALAPVVLEHSTPSRELAEAALRIGNEALFEKAMALNTMESFEASLTEGRAVELVQAGQPALAFRLLEGVTRAPAAGLTAWNNAAYCLHHQLKAQKGRKSADIPKDRLERFLAGAMEVGRSNSAVFHNLAGVLVELGRFDEALSAVEAAAQSSYPQLAQMKTDADLAPIRRAPRFQAAFRAKNAKKSGGSIAHLVIERSEKGKKHRIVAPAVGLHLYFDDHRAAPEIADVVESLAAEFPEMFAYYRPSSTLALVPAPKGRLARDLTLLRKRPTSVEIQYDSARGAACDQRVFVSLDDDFKGELSIHLPLSLADNPDALFERFLGYARNLPFATGNAGLTLTPYEVGNLVGLATDAEAELFRLLPEYLGLTASQSQSSSMLVDTSFVVPSWLTFLGPKALKKAGPKLAAAVASATVTELLKNRAVIRAAVKPFVGAANSPSDLGALPKVVRALKSLLPRRTDPDSYLTLEARRLAEILLP